MLHNPSRPAELKELVKVELHGQVAVVVPLNGGIRIFPEGCKRILLGTVERVRLAKAPGHDLPCGGKRIAMPPFIGETQYSQPAPAPFYGYAGMGRGRVCPGVIDRARIFRGWFQGVLYAGGQRRPLTRVRVLR